MSAFTTWGVFKANHNAVPKPSADTVSNNVGECNGAYRRDLGFVFSDDLPHVWLQKTYPKLAIFQDGPRGRSRWHKKGDENA